MRQRVGGFPVLIITGETTSAALREASERGFKLLQKPGRPPRPCGKPWSQRVGGLTDGQTVRPTHSSVSTIFPVNCPAAIICSAASYSSKGNTRSMSGCT